MRIIEYQTYREEEILPLYASEMCIRDRCIAAHFCL